MTIAGVDSFRGPYQEDVSTIAVSCHGCRYESKYEVLPEASVLLQLNPKVPGAKPVSTRGRVKWTKRPPETGGLFQTAIELEQPGNIWGIDAPPSDWATFVAQRPVESDTTKAKQVAVLRPNIPNLDLPPVPDLRAKPGPASSRPAESRPPEAPTPAPATGGQQAGAFAGGFQQQLEKMLSEMAEFAARERTAVVLSEMRTQLRAEVQHVMAEASSKQTDRLAESARTLHGQWTKKIEGDLQHALGRMDMRRRELEELSERLTAKTHDKLETFLESSRKDAVDKIVVRLKEQTTPVIESARKAASELTKQEQELEKLQRKFLEKSAEQMEETCTRLDRQFEMILRERLDGAREELDRGAMEVAKIAVGQMKGLTAKEQEAARAEMQRELREVARQIYAGIEAKADVLRKHFEGELSRQSSEHLEFVSGALGQLAKGFGKLSKD